MSVAQQVLAPETDCHRARVGQRGGAGGRPVGTAAGGSGGSRRRAAAVVAAILLAEHLFIALAAARGTRHRLARRAGPVKRRNGADRWTGPAPAPPRRGRAGGGRGARRHAGGDLVLAVRAAYQHCPGAGGFRAASAPPGAPADGVGLAARAAAHRAAADRLRRQRRAVLTTASTAITVMEFVAVIAAHRGADIVAARSSWFAGLPDPVFGQVSQVMAVLTMVLVALAAVNVIIMRLGDRRGRPGSRRRCPARSASPGGRSACGLALAQVPARPAGRGARHAPWRAPVRGRGLDRPGAGPMRPRG